MRVLMTIGDGYLPQLLGGAQSSTHQLASQLVDHGHEVAVACRLKPAGWLGLRGKLLMMASRRPFALDRKNGYEVYRGWSNADPLWVVNRVNPDVAVVQVGPGYSIEFARRMATVGVPTVLYFRNVELDQLGGDPATVPGARYIANSNFTAGRFLELFGVHSTVIPPLVDQALYATQTNGENVTFINPYPQKGVDLVLEVAKLCPNIPFKLVESWTLGDEQKSTLLSQLTALPNVTLLAKTSDMKLVYGKARILLAPSRWEEAWGRVATEAHLSGIPVIGSRRGGLPEAIGPGGIVLDYDSPAAKWADAVQLLWNDRSEYDRLSALALDFSKRNEMNSEVQFRAFLSVLEDAVRTGSNSEVMG